MSKRRESTVSDQANHDTDGEPASTQKWDPKETIRTLRLVKNKFPELSFILDTATGQIRIQRVDQAHDVDHTSSRAAAMPSHGIVSEAIAMVADANRRPTSLRWSEAEDRILENAYEQGSDLRHIQKTFLPQRTVLGIRNRLQWLRLRNPKLRERRELSLASNFTAGVQRPRWDNAADQALNDACGHGLEVLSIQRQYFPGPTREAVKHRMYLLGQTRTFDASTQSPKSAKRNGWTAAEEQALMYASHRGLSIAYIQKQLFPERSYDTVRWQLKKIKAWNAEETVNSLIHEGNNTKNGSASFNSEVPDHRSDSDSGELSSTAAFKTDMAEVDGPSEPQEDKTEPETSRGDGDKRMARMQDVVETLRESMNQLLSTRL